MKDGGGEAPLGLTRTCNGRTMAAGDRERRKENASRSGRILADNTTRGGAPLWSLYNTTPILASTTPRPRRFQALFLLFPTAVLIPTVEPRTR